MTVGTVGPKDWTWNWKHCEQSHRSMGWLSREKKTCNNKKKYHL